MKTKQVLKGLLPLLGVLILCSLLIPAIPPANTRAWALRIGSVNAAPHIVMSLTFGTNASPSVKNEKWDKRYADGDTLTSDLNHKP